MFKFKFLARRLVVAGVLFAAAAGAQASLVISFNFTGLTSAEQGYFTSAKSFWESKLTGYQPGVSLTPSITINAIGASIDGVGGILGYAGPTTIANNGGYVVARTGDMEFDVADIAALGAAFADLILHEMAHVLGFGTLWTDNNVYVDGTGRYTGGAALAEYRTEFGQPGAAFVPVELGGGPGTANGHWDEVDGGNGGPSDPFRNELMSGWLNTPSWVSRTTIASFQDIGYTVNLGNTVPEPGTIALLLSVLPLLAGTRRGRKVS